MFICLHNVAIRVLSKIVLNIKPTKLGLGKMINIRDVVNAALVAQAIVRTIAIRADGVVGVHILINKPAVRPHRGPTPDRGSVIITARRRRSHTKRRTVAFIRRRVRAFARIAVVISIKVIMMIVNLIHGAIASRRRLLLQLRQRRTMHRLSWIHEFRRISSVCARLWRRRRHGHHRHRHDLMRLGRRLLYGRVMMRWIMTVVRTCVFRRLAVHARHVGCYRRRVILKHTLDRKHVTPHALVFIFTNTHNTNGRNGQAVHFLG